MPAELRVTAWTPDDVVMGLAHRVAPAVGRPVPSRVDLHRARRAACCATSATSRAQRRRPATLAARAAARPAAGTRVHHRTLDALVRPRGGVRRPLRRPRHAVWLDSSRVERRLARFSFMGAPDGPLGQIVRYDVADGLLDVQRADGREELHESVLDYCERELARLRADAPDLPFDFTCGFAGYLGYELKADCGGELVHRSPLPDAALVFCDRLIAFDHARAARPPARARGRRGRRRRPTPGWRPPSGELEGLAGRPPPALPRQPPALSFAAREVATPTWPTSPPASTRSSRARPTRSA